MTDPMERIVAAGLDAAGIRYTTDEGGGNRVGLDFHLTDYGLHIEVKQFHSPRIAEQMSRADNVIAVQGRAAVEWFAALLSGVGFDTTGNSGKTPKSAGPQAPSFPMNKADHAGGLAIKERA